MSVEYEIYEPRETEERVVSHMIQNKVYLEGHQTWTVAKSSLGGRGIFATTNIKQGELISIDAPLLIGPRALPKHLPMCVNCYKKGCPLFPCDRGCGLPVCSTECENSPNHTDRECKYLRSLIPTCGTDWCNELLLVVTPIRGLFMTEQQRKCMAVFQHHRLIGSDAQIDILSKKLAHPVPDEDIKFMKYVCEIFNTNSFETVSVQDTESSASLRGLYPIGALQNHCCIPNTRHHFDNECRLYVYAVRDISAGEELTMAYTSLFWDTTLRRQFLNVTKRFWCQCVRCQDLTEFGTNLGALWCASNNCSGVLLPRESLNLESPWICNKCNVKIKSRQIASIRSGLAALVEETQYQQPRQVLRFMKKDLADLVPDSNYLMVDMKFRIISYLGRTPGLMWQDLTDNELVIKKKYCKDLISILDTLNCGDCKKKGLVLYELYCTNNEQIKRIQKTQNGCDQNSSIPTEINIHENEELLRKAKDILQNDVVAITLQKADGLY